MRVLSALVSAFLGLSPLDATATCHLMEIVEVFAGTTANPSAQYVVLRTTATNQHFVEGATIETSTGVFGTFPGHVPAASDAGAHLLVATGEAATLFSIAEDATAPGTVLLDFPDGSVRWRCQGTIWELFDYGNVEGSQAFRLIRGCALKKVGGHWTLGDPEPANSAGASSGLPGSCALPDGGLPEPPFRLDGGATDGEPDAPPPAPDGALRTLPPEDEGCACALGSSPRGPLWLAGALGLLLLCRRRST